MSATEIISEGPEGIILEFQQNTTLPTLPKRLSVENILLRWSWNVWMGDIDPLASPFVLESFTKYRDGLTMKEIRDWLNENGIKNPVGGEFTYNSVEHMRKNRRYIGELKFRDVVVPDAISSGTVR